ncbi:four helix bundle protein [Candidatus Laterigemmans baculatus]|uniref:four helix bundle protein n=1 Tax=Candidatus Laterigemmans baculatus TaxID=2770505 RepID=UPI0013DC56FC|nr:four helix bundle protein [Candidatus Laterigemmans baculatus]
MRNHHNLRAFQLADELAVAVYRHTANFPREEQFGLTSQVRGAAVSVPSNIVEGCAKASEADYVRFLDIAYGSACETQYQLSLAHRLGFLSDEGFAAVDTIAVETAKVINGLIRAIRKRSEV